MVVVNKKNLKEFIGIVVSDAMNKTLVVSMPVVKVHPLYKKRHTIYKKYYVHDEGNIATKGDKVRIRQDKPTSKNKRWKLMGIEK